MKLFPSTKASSIAPALLTALLFLGLTACASETETSQDTGTEVQEEVQGEDMSEMESGASDVTAQGTVSLLQGGLTNIATDQAVQNIDGWLARIDDANNDALDAVADNLEELKTALQADEIDGAEVGNLLTELGQQTSETASAATGQQMTQLQALGEALTSGGEQLTSGGGM